VAHVLHPKAQMMPLGRHICRRKRAMPKTQREEDKKHGDKLESLIERTGGSSSSQRRTERAAGDDATQLQDDDDEDVQNDDVEDRRDVGNPE
jgi:hypothetical protein